MCPGPEAGVHIQLQPSFPCLPRRKCTQTGFLETPPPRSVYYTVLQSGTDMSGRLGHRTMEMTGGSSASYLARTPCVPLLCTLFHRPWGGNRRAFRLPGEGGDHFHCTVEPSSGHSGKKKAHKHKSFRPVTPPVTGGPPNREARCQSLMCYPRNPRNINLFVRIPDREDRWPGRPGKVLCAKVLCAFSAP